MPFIDVKIIEGVLDDAQKQRLIAELAESRSSPRPSSGSAVKACAR
jgi:hypothetical protein